MYEINADEQERYIAEAQEKYLSTLASVRAEGRDKWIEEGRKESAEIIARLERSNAESAETIARLRTESAETIARLERRIAELETQLVDS